MACSPRADEFAGVESEIEPARLSRGHRGARCL